MNNLPEDIQGQRVFLRGNMEDRGTVTRDLREERVKVLFDDGSEEWVDRDDVEVFEDDE